MEKVGGALTKGITLPILAGAAAVTTAAVKWESDFAGVKRPMMKLWIRQVRLFTHTKI